MNYIYSVEISGTILETKACIKRLLDNPLYIGKQPWKMIGYFHHYDEAIDTVNKVTDWLSQDDMTKDMACEIKTHCLYML